MEATNVAMHFVGGFEMGTSAMNRFSRAFSRPVPQRLAKRAVSRARRLVRGEAALDVKEKHLRRSLAIPVYNQEAVVAELLRRTTAGLDSLPGGPHETVLADDGSFGP
jgi:hypothetical protein